MNDKEEPKDKLPPAVDEALTKLTEIFSDPSLQSKARLRCGTEGPGSPTPAHENSARKKSERFPAVNTTRPLANVCFWGCNRHYRFVAENSAIL
jgi:hypothetical protein